MSFWSMPMRFAPLGLRRPQTVKMTLLRRMRRPTGEAPSGKSASATVLPRTQTVAAEETSRSVNAAPSSNDHSFTSKKSAEPDETCSGW